MADECDVWQRWERDLPRTWARANGVQVELQLLGAVEVLMARMAARNCTLPDGAPRTTLVALWDDRIQRPDADELAGARLTGRRRAIEPRASRTSDRTARAG